MSDTASAAEPKAPPYSDAKKRLDAPSPDFLVATSLLGDVLMILIGLSIGYWIRFQSGWITFGVELQQPVAFANYWGLIMIGTVFLLLTFGYLNLYDYRHLLRYRRISLILVKGATFWLFAYLGLSLALKFDPPISRIYVASSYVTCLITLLAWRLAFHKVLHRESVAKGLRQRILFVGWNSHADRLTTMVEADLSHPYEIAGVIPSSHGPFGLNPPPNIQRMGDYSELEDLLKRSDIDIVVLADLDPAMEEIVSLSNLCEKHFIQFKIIPSYFQILVSGLQLESISGVPILGVTELPLDRLLNRFLKRTVDVVGAMVGLTISAPLIAVCGLMIYWESPGSIFFIQERIGRNGRRFRMLKLRSMKLDADKTDNDNQSTLRDDPRVLKIGSLMRRWNLDEIPQFLNVLKGDMSLVGPRPERTFHSNKLSEEIPHYNARYANKPGMTGWAQVNGLRGDTSLVDRVQYDLFYLENWSLWLDFQIMFLTFFKRTNAY